MNFLKTKLFLVLNILLTINMISIHKTKYLVKNLFIYSKIMNLLE